MRVSASLLLIFVSTSHCLSFLEVVLTEWESWKVSNMKRYNSDTEDNFRLKIYMENKAKIDRHNKKAYSGHHSYFLKMNKYGDLLHHEFRQVMNGYKMRAVNQTKPHLGATYIKAAHLESLPRTVDWRQLGAVTGVKDQVPTYDVSSLDSPDIFNIRVSVAAAGHSPPPELWRP